MTIEKRPVVVSILAGAAFLAFAVLSLGSILSLKNLTMAIRDHEAAASFVLMIVEGCFIALAWILAATGRDLWALRKRGRTLALIFLSILCLVGLAIAGPDRHGLLFWLGFSVFALGLGAIGYLIAPNIRRKFVSEASLPWTLPSPCPRLVVGITSLASAGCILGAASIRLWSSFDWFPGLAILSIFWLPYIFIPSRLWGDNIKSGLTLAVAMGSALVLPGIAVLYYVHDREESVWIQVLLLLGLMLQPILVAAAQQAYKSLPTESPDRRQSAISYAYGVLVFGLFWFVAIYGNFPSRITYNERQAMESMRSVYMAADSYATAHQGFFPDTRSDSVRVEKPECAHDRPRMYHDDASDGYIISYEVISARTPLTGCHVATSYVGIARPIIYGKTGRRSFFVDSTRIIRFTSENRPATVNDPEIPAGSLPPL